MSGKKKPLKPNWNRIIALLSGFFGLLLLGMVISHSLNTHLAKNSLVVSIKPGSSTNQIGLQLQKQGLIRYPHFFSALAILSRSDKNLHAGFYKIPKSSSYLRIIGILEEKEGPASLVAITIPEGLNLNEIATLIEANHISTKAEFMDCVYTAKTTYKDQLPFLADVTTNNLEGYLFPDTYIFAQGVPVSTIVRSMLKTFNRKVVPIWEANPSIHKKFTLHQALTLASLIEREAGKKREMPLISAVFQNRLRDNMALGSCPTVAYALGQSRKRYIYFKDLKVESPYNTYRHTGLPPTPIASPGIMAFKAALAPSENFQALFFVANGDGTHQFSTTFKEHCEKQRIILKRQSKLPIKSGYLIVDPINLSKPIH